MFLTLSPRNVKNTLKRLKYINPHYKNLTSPFGEFDDISDVSSDSEMESPSVAEEDFSDEQPSDTILLKLKCS